jgi:hypothetical protein
MLSLKPELKSVSEVTFRGKYESIIQPYKVFRPISMADGFEVVIMEVPRTSTPSKSSNYAFKKGPQNRF